MDIVWIYFKCQWRISVWIGFRYKYATSMDNYI